MIKNIIQCLQCRIWLWFFTGNKSGLTYVFSICSDHHHHHHHHHHRHQGLDPLICSVSKVTTALSNVSSVFQLFSFLVVCSSKISVMLSLRLTIRSYNPSFHLPEQKILRSIYEQIMIMFKFVLITLIRGCFSTIPDTPSLSE